MAYILFVNPQILGSVAAPGGVKLPFDQVLTVTALVAGIATVAMGVFGRYPFALAAGLGINAFVAFALVGADHLSWPDAMGVIVAEGAIITVLVLSRLPRGRSSTRSPTTSSWPSASAIGLFITIIGLVDAGIVIKGTGTVVTLAPKLNTWPIAVFAVGLFGTYALFIRRVPGALLFGILGTTILATVINEIKDKKVFPNGAATWPNQGRRHARLQPGGELLLALRLGAGLLERARDRAVGAAVGLLRHGGDGPRPRAPRGPGHAGWPPAGHAPRADRRLAGRGGGRRRVGVVEHDLHRELGGHRRRSSNGPCLGGDGAALPGLPVHLAAGPTSSPARPRRPCS